MLVGAGWDGFKLRGTGGYGTEILSPCSLYSVPKRELMGTVKTGVFTSWMPFMQ